MLALWRNGLGRRHGELHSRRGYRYLRPVRPSPWSGTEQPSGHRLLISDHSESRAVVGGKQTRYGIFWIIIGFK